MEQFNQKKLKAAVHKADRLAKELGAQKLENEKLEEDVERLLGKYVMEAEARQKDMVHNILLKAELEVWKTYPRGVPPGPSREQLQKQREAEAEQKKNEAELRAKHQHDFGNSPMQLYIRDMNANLARDPDFYRRRPAPACMRREFFKSGIRKRLTQHVPCGSIAMAANCRRS
jgi:hypothetical protein